MIESPQLIQRAASFDWETLLPVIFFVLYGLAQFIGSRKKGDAVEEDIENGEDDPMDKARQIREEIRRKIEERKQGAGRSAERDQGTRKAAYDPNLPESRQDQRRQTDQQAAKKRPVVVHQAKPVQTQPPVSGIEERLKEQQKRLREARRQHEAAMVQARKMTHDAGVKRQADSRTLLEHRTVALDSPQQLRDAVLKGLRHPNSLRQAILYREILDPPIGLR